MSDQQTTTPTPVKMYRTPDRLSVAAPMPGLLPEDIEVEITPGNRLVLHGSPRGTLKKDVFLVHATDVRDGHPQAHGGTAEALQQGALGEAWEETREVLLDEWQAGGYHRELELPMDVDGTRATVTYGNGVLVVVLPITEGTRPARLVLETTGPARGERVGSASHPVQPLTTAEHREARASDDC